MKNTISVVIVVSIVVFTMYIVGEGILEMAKSICDLLRSVPS